MKEKIKGHGYFRKSKAFGLVSGIALGGLLVFAGNVAQADEVKPTNSPKTEEVVTQIVEAKDPVLAETVKKAESLETVTVEKTATVEHASKAEAEASQAAQAKDLAEKVNKQAQAEAKYQAKKGDNAYEKAKNSGQVIAEKGGMIVYGKEDEKATGYEHFKNIKVVNDPTVTKTEDLNGSLGFTKESSITDFNGFTVEKDEQHEGYILTNYKKGSNFRLNNIGSLKDGRKVSAKVTFLHDSNPILPDNGKQGFRPELQVYYYLNKDEHMEFIFNNERKLELQFDWLDENNKPLNLALATLVADVDLKQGSNLSFSGQTVTKYISKYNTDLTTDKDGNIWAKEFKGLSSTSDLPQGGYLTAGYGTSMIYTHFSNFYNTYPKTKEELEDMNWKLGANKGLVAFDLFGKTNSIAITEGVAKPEQLTISYHDDVYREKVTAAKPVAQTPAPKSSGQVATAAVSPTSPAPALPETGSNNGASIMALGLGTLVIGALGFTSRKKDA